MRPLFFHSDLKRFAILVSYKDYSKKVESFFLDYLKEHGRVTQATKQFGKFPLLFQIRARNEEEIQEIMIDIRDKFSIIGDFEVIPIFKDIQSNILPIES